MRLPRPSFTYANVVASLALFIALGGTSFAAVKLSKGSVTSREVKDRSLLADDLAPGVIGSGPAGARGPRGADGPAGAPGERGPSNVLFTSAGFTALASQPSVTTKVLSLNNVPAGNYLVVFTGEAGLRVASAGMYIVCVTRLNGTDISMTKGIVGDAYGGDAGLSDMITVSRTTPFDLSVGCHVDQAIAGGWMEHNKLAVIATGGVTTR